MTTKQKRAAAQKAKRDRDRAAGLCLRNSRHGKAVKNRSCCRACLDYMAMRFNARVPPADRAPIAAPAPRVGSCTECHRYDAMSWTTICWTCADQAAKAA